MPIQDGAMGNGANPDSQTLQVIGLWARQFMRGTPEEVPVPRKINSILFVAGNLNKGVGGEYFCLTISKHLPCQMKKNLCRREWREILRFGSAFRGIEVVVHIIILIVMKGYAYHFWMHVANLSDTLDATSG